MDSHKLFSVTPPLKLFFIAAVPASCIILVVFSALWGSRYAVFASVSALLNSLLILAAGLSTGLSFLISMIAATIFGALIYTDEEAGIE